MNQGFSCFYCLILIISCNEKRGINTRINQPVIIRYTLAQRISIEKASDYTKVTIINPWQGAENVNMTYYLVRRGSDIPAGIDSSMVIFVPVKKIVCMSTTHVAMISALGEENSIAGMSGTGFIYSEYLNSRVEEGFIK